MEAGNGRICITSFAETAHITVSQPGITDPNSAFYYPTTTYTLPPYSSTNLVVSNNKGDLHRATPSAVIAHGVHVESDADISVYYAQVNKNSEIYVMKGSNALGTNFLVSMQRTHSNGYGASTIEIVATEPNTTVTIITKIPTKIYPAAGTYTIKLQPGEIFTLEAAGTRADQHLGGTIIRSDKPVAVNSTDDSVADYGQDLVGDQLVPASLAGSEYIAMRHNGNAEELVLYSFDKAITYTINGGAEKNLAASSAVSINLKTEYPDDSVLYIKSKGDEKFVAFQLTSDNAELGGTILPQLGCTGSREVAVRKCFKSQQLNILVKTTDTASFAINGSAVHLPFRVVPGTGDKWSYCYVDASKMFDSNGVIRVHNTSAIFHLAILDYGETGGTCSYGYFSGYNQIAMVPQSPKVVYTTGDTLNLSVEGENLFKNIKWFYPDGTEHPGATQSVPIKSISDAGYYRVTGESKDECALSKPNYEILIHVLVPERHDSTICRSSRYPEDTKIMVDTTQLGCNILKDAVDIPSIPCAAGGYTTAYQTQTTVSSSQAYQISFDYKSPSYPTAAPNIQLVLNDSVHKQIDKALVRNQYKSLQYSYQPSISGVLRLKILAGGVGNSSTVAIKNLKIEPVLPRQDTLYMHVEDCECPEPVVMDSAVRTHCDTLGAYPWRGRSLTESGIYRDTIPSPRGCDSLFYILNLKVVHCEPPCPDPEVKDSSAVVLCDTLLPYSWRDTLITKPGIYRDTVWSLRHCDSLYYILSFDTIHCEQPLPKDTCYNVIAQRWNDILGVLNSEYNGGYSFVSYRWYCNDVELTEEKKSYIYVPATFKQGDCYSAVMTTVDGKTMKACPFCPEHIELKNDGLEPAATKLIEDNHLVIIRNNQRYNANGQMIK